VKLIVGLGNPGIKFAATRHNVGFRAIDLFAQKNNYLPFQKKFNGLFFKTAHFILLKPQSYMNCSGTVIAQTAHFFKIKTTDILIIYDDIALPLGQLRIKSQGRSGGQKGMQNSIDHLQTNQLWRVRIGVGYDPNYQLSDWVLAKLKDSEKIILAASLQKAVQAITLFIEGKMEKAMQDFN